MPLVREPRQLYRLTAISRDFEEATKMSVLFSGRELINIAIGIERNGLAFYESLLKVEKDAMARGAYKYLADMEEQHIKTFQRMVNTVGEYGHPSPN